MDKLSEHGVARADARLELLKVLHGETSSLIDELLDSVSKDENIKTTSW